MNTNMESQYIVDAFKCVILGTKAYLNELTAQKESKKSRLRGLSIISLVGREYSLLDSSVWLSTP